MNDEELVQYCADLARGMSSTTREDDCGRRCMMFGIEMGYKDAERCIDEDIPVCNCDHEQYGYKIGRELNGRPMNLWEKIWAHLT